MTLRKIWRTAGVLAALLLIAATSAGRTAAARADFERSQQP